ncbi:MAG: alpha/beta fold hydrolase [Gemmatimonadaceae bacterium]
MIWALHGFLGRGVDWHPFGDLLRELGDGEPRTPDLFSSPANTRQTPAEWARAFVARIAAEDPSPSIVGYSMGGRLALHALLARPGLFERATLVSTGLGIDDPDLRNARLLSDERWATRFETDDWDTVIAAWNSQEVFGGARPVTERREGDFNRMALGGALRSWSPAAHEPLAQRLPGIETPVLLIAGEQDARYAREAERAARLLPNARVSIVPAAGHRVPWEQHERFSESLRSFFQTSHHEIP